MHCADPLLHPPRALGSYIVCSGNASRHAAQFQVHFIREPDGHNLTDRWVVADIGTRKLS